MDTPYIGEIKLVSFATLPSGWAFCNGQELQIAQHTALFSVLGTSYGGNGVNTFCLPYMCGKIGLHASPFIPVGAQGGEAKHVLTMGEMPKHNHQGLPAVKGAGVKTTPVNSYPAGTGTTSQYSVSGQGAAWAKMHPAAIATAGLGAPHENMMPYVTLNWIIATSGIVPSR